jgi:hypothetical protein
LKVYKLLAGVKLCTEFGGLYLKNQMQDTLSNFINSDQIISQTYDGEYLNKSHFMCKLKCNNNKDPEIIEIIEDDETTEDDTCVILDDLEENDDILVNFLEDYGGVDINKYDKIIKETCKMNYPGLTIWDPIHLLQRILKQTLNLYPELKPFITLVSKHVRRLRMGKAKIELDNLLEKYHIKKGLISLSSTRMAQFYEVFISRFLSIYKHVIKCSNEDQVHQLTSLSFIKSILLTKSIVSLLRPLFGIVQSSSGKVNPFHIINGYDEVLFNLIELKSTRRINNDSNNKNIKSNYIFKDIKTKISVIDGIEIKTYKYQEIELHSTNLRNNKKDQKCKFEEMQDKMEDNMINMLVDTPMVKSKIIHAKIKQYN